MKETNCKDSYAKFKDTSFDNGDNFTLKKPSIIEQFMFWRFLKYVFKLFKKLNSFNDFNNDGTILVSNIVHEVMNPNQNRHIHSLVP